MKYSSNEWREFIKNDSANEGLLDIKSQIKTEEEIKQLTIDENLNEIDRTVYLLHKGQQTQKLAIYSKLNQILREKGALEKVLPILIEQLQNEDQSIIVECGNSLQQFLLAKFRPIPQKQLYQIFKLTIVIFNIWSMQVLQQWALVFNSVLELLPFDLQIEKECTSLVMNLSDQAQPQQSRYISARIIGFLANKMKSKFPSALVQKLRKLCEDHDVEIRKIIVVEVLEQVCQVVSQDTIEFDILAKIMELVYDAEINVKVEAIKLVFKVSNYFSENTKSSWVSTFFTEIMQSVNEEVVKTVSNLLGTIIFQLEPYLKRNPGQINIILKNYKQYGQHKLDDVRNNFAFNFPAVLKIIDLKQFDHFKEIYISLLLNDSSENVRITAIGCLPIICELIGVDEAHNSLKVAIVKLFKENNGIIDKFVTVLPNVILNMYKKDSLNDSLLSQNLCETFTEINQLYNRIIKTNNWRLQYKLLECIGRVMKCFPLQLINEKLIIQILLHLKSAVFEVKKKIVQILIIWLRRNHFSKKRQEFFKHFKEQFLKSNSYHHRLIFLYFVELFVGNFSRNFIYKSKIINDSLDLYSDKVSNIRLKLSSLLYKFRNILVEEDTENLQKLDYVIKQLLVDQQQDVKKCITLINQQIIDMNFQSPEYLMSIKDDDQKKLLHENKLSLKEQQSIEESKRKINDEFDYFSYDPKAKKGNKIMIGTQQQSLQLQRNISKNNCNLPVGQPVLNKITSQKKSLGNDLKKGKEEKKKPMSGKNPLGYNGLKGKKK